MKRRKFLKTTAAVSAASMLAATRSHAKSKKRLIGIQIGAVSYVDEGENKVLDNVQKLAGVNTLFIPVFAYNKGLAGRGYRKGDKKYRGAVADHGKTNYDRKWFHGGYYAAPHMKYYKDTVFKDLRAPEFGDYDVLASVIPEAKKRGMTTYAMMADNFRRNLPNAKKLMQIDLNGKLRGTVCFNNPEYQGFLMGLVEDCTRSYDINGLLWRSEKTGPLTEMLGLSHSPGKGGKAGCFCQFCKDRAKKEGVNVDRATNGFRELRKFVKKSSRGDRYVDGSYVTFWRILLNYPEILQWQRLFTNSLRDTYKAVYAKVKSIKPEIPVGWGFSSQQLYSHLFRADADIQALDGYTDFLKFYTYYNVGGPRSAKYIEKLGKNILGDVPREQLTQFVFRLMGYGDEGSFDDIRRRGYTDDYVHRETKRALKGAEKTSIHIWPAIDINLPGRNYWKNFKDYSLSNPESIKKAVKAVFQAGSDRILLARKYSEMKLTNLKAVGQVLQKL